MSASKVVDGTEMSLAEIIEATGIRAPAKKRQNFYINQRSEPMDQTDFDPNIPDASSQQWRLKDPNRLVGMAPLIPSNARQRLFKAGQYQYKNRRNNTGYVDRDKPLVGVDRKNQPNFKNNLRQNAIFKAALRNTTNSNFHSNGSCTDLVPYRNNGPATMNQLSEGLVGLVVPLLNSHCGDAFSQFMKAWSEKEARKPKYDMNVQKEIAEIQRKPLFFLSGGGEPPTVVSSNGFGIDDCAINVSTTDTSMHQRFA